MDIFFWVILTITLLLSLALIIMVLLQPSKGGGITAAFGGIGGTLGSTFGQRRTLEALGKGTTYVAVAIATLSIIANIFFIPENSNNGVGPVTQGAQAPNVSTVPGAGDRNLDQQSAPATGGEATEGGEAAGNTPPATDAPATEEAPAPAEAPADGE